MRSGRVIGQTLDGKYKIENELGRGGMGTVYLATHVGTGRPVAVKVITPDFMQRAEFVERFRREARAAGKLRHPNVVNVTDFGFAEVSEGQVAYLVMEYLDGCTLGEILEEEKKLPLQWTIDILEQVCSAVQEAHERGIIHRDLKPDNIWLEPNQRGGYTVKVLDFGIAKLEESIVGEAQNAILPEAFAVTPTQDIQRATVPDLPRADTAVKNKQNSTAVSEAATIAQTGNISELDTEAGTQIKSNEIDSEGGTAILPAAEEKNANHSVNANIGTRLIPQPVSTDKSLQRVSTTKDLTHVGAVLGTPLYMSPEQCRGEKLSPSSDIYSLGVIAYQMLSGNTPFTGDFKTVMEAHREVEPPKLDVKNVRKKVKKVIGLALSKNPEDRPPTAQSFASELRAQSEGIWTLLQRALVIYSQHLPKFLGLAILLYSPVAIITFAQVVFRVFTINADLNNLLEILIVISFSIASTFLGIFCGYLLFGTTTWLVGQILAFPLRPVRIRPALAATRKKWKTFAGTGMLTATLTIVGYAFCLFPGLILNVIWALVAQVVMMENLRGFAALKRSKKLVMRSLRTTAAAICIMFFVPFFLSSLTAFVVNRTVDSFDSKTETTAASPQQPISEQSAQQTEQKGETEQAESRIKVNTERGEKININLGDGKKNKKEKDMGERIRTTVREALTQIILLPISILIGSFASVVSALLYMKTRQVGGESMQDLLAQFEETDAPKSNWQRRVRERLQQSGKLTSKS
jgi:serine/threonine protein kinase